MAQARRTHASLRVLKEASCLCHPSKISNNKSKSAFVSPHQRPTGDVASAADGRTKSTAQSTHASAPGVAMPATPPWSNSAAVSGRSTSESMSRCTTRSYSVRSHAQSCGRGERGERRCRSSRVTPRKWGHRVESSHVARRTMDVEARGATWPADERQASDLPRETAFRIG